MLLTVNYNLLIINLFDCNLTLWERNLDVVIVERIVDALHDGGIVDGLGKHVHPYDNPKGDAAVIETLQ